MPVAVQGYTQAVYWSSGQGTIAWPGGTAVGMICYLGCAATTSSTPKKQPQNTAGWNLAKTTPSTKSWWKVLTAADIAVGLPCFGNVVFLVVLSGATRIGNVTDQPGATITSANGGLIMFGRGKKSLSSLTPATGKLGTDVTNPAYDDRKNNVWFRAASAIGYLAVDGTFNGTDSDGFEVLPTLIPDPPTLLSPLSGALINPAQVNVFTIIHQSSNPQTNIKLKTREVSTGTWYYLQSNGTLTASETAISTSSPNASLNAAQYTTAKNYEWTAATSDDGGSTYSSYQSINTLTTVTAPTVNTITPTSPAGDLAPDIAFTMTANYGAHIASQVRICPSADVTSETPLWDSGVVAGTDLFISVPSSSSEIWTNGATLYAWVRVQQTGGLWSAWTKDDATFTVSWTPPTAPSSVTAANQINGPVQVTVSGITAPATTVPMTNLVPNGGFDNLEGWDTGGGMGTADAGRIACLRTPATSAQVRRSFTLISGHKYYAAATFTGGTPGSTAFKLLGDSGSTSSGTERLSRVVTGNGYTFLEFYDSRSTGTVFYVDNVLLIDMTEAFGAGNEKTKSQMDSLMTAWTESWFDGSYDPTTAHEVQVEYSTDAGVTWLPVTSVNPTSSSIVVNIPGAEYGASQYYRARQRSSMSGFMLWSSWTATASGLASTDLNAYLIDALDHTNYILVHFAPKGMKRSEVRGIAMYYGLDDDKARIDRYQPQGDVGQFILRSQTKAEKTAIRTFLNSYDLILVRWNPERDVTDNLYYGEPSTLISVVSEFQLDSIVDIAVTDKDIPVNWVEQ